MKIRKISENNYLDALLKLMLLSAIIHVGILIIYSLANQSFEKFNFFYILDVQLLFPLLKNTLSTILIGTVLMILIYIFFLSNSKNKR
ncbi:Uncharacterised protein [uncultured archaeon]|nr:Uncharacterised protein [uncultured archaeon]